MEAMIGLGLLIALIVGMWKFSSYLTVWTEQREEALKADIAEESVDIARQNQETNKKLKALIDEVGEDKLVSAQNIIDRARGK